MPSEKSGHNLISRRRRLIGGVVFTVGYILSPVSWWNDAVVNLPAAYIIGWVFSKISPQLFLPFMLIGYWATNIIGIIMLHIGGTLILRRKLPKNPWRLWRMFLIATIYTIVVILLVQLGILRKIGRAHV